MTRRRQWAEMVQPVLSLRQVQIHPSGPWKIFGVRPLTILVWKRHHDSLLFQALPNPMVASLVYSKSRFERLQPSQVDFLAS
jgi:hypothetical protein